MQCKQIVCMKYRMVLTVNVVHWRAEVFGHETRRRNIFIEWCKISKNL